MNHEKNYMICLILKNFILGKMGFEPMTFCLFDRRSISNQLK